LSAQVGQTMRILRLKGEALSLLFSGHAARLIPPETVVHVRSSRLLSKEKSREYRAIPR
jgi:hypothetical protein